MQQLEYSALRMALKTFAGVQELYQVNEVLFDGLKGPRSSLHIFGNEETGKAVVILRAEDGLCQVYALQNDRPTATAKIAFLQEYFATSDDRARDLAADIEARERIDE